MTTINAALKTSPTSDDAIRLELVNILYRHSPQVFLGNIAVAGLSTFLLWSEVPHRVLLTWAIAIYVLTAIRIAMVWRDRREPAHPVATARYRGWRYALLSGLSGCLWGAMGIVFFAPGDAIITVYICIVVSSMTSGSVASLSSFQPAYYAYALPAVLPFTIHSFMVGSSLFTVFGVLSLFLLGVNFAYSRNMQRTVRDAVALRFENIGLIRQLTAEKERAETANRSKSQFLAAASHDLRQPTHALGLYIATLRAVAHAPHVEPTDVRNLAARLQTALMDMSQLLNVLLDISRLDAAVIRVSKSRFALQTKLDVLEHQFGHAAAAKGLTLKVLPTEIWLETDPVLLQNILSNLLSNAVRYTVQGKILLACRRRKGETEIRIFDTGIGIAADQFSAIFREFYQVDNIARDREQGLGLGLAIVERTAALLGARIELRSMLGKGSRFSVFLPGGQDKAPLPLMADTPIADLTAAQERDQDQKQGHRRKIVLVVEDDKQVLASMETLLDVWGFQVIAVRSRENALSAVTAMIADGDELALVLSDFWLANDVTGIDVILAVHECIGLPVPGIIITGDTSTDGINTATASGFQVLHKPLNPEQLRAAIIVKLDAREIPASADSL